MKEIYSLYKIVYLYIRTHVNVIQSPIKFFLHVELATIHKVLVYLKTSCDMIFLCCYYEVIYDCC